MQGRIVTVTLYCTALVKIALCGTIAQNTKIVSFAVCKADQKKLYHLQDKCNQKSGLEHICQEQP